MKILIEIFNIIVLGCGTYYALYDDRKGDKHPNNDWIGIGIVMLVSASVFALVHSANNWHLFARDLVRGLSMATGLYIVIFPWAINYLLIKNKVIQLRKGEKWYNHFSKTAIPDKWLWWNTLHWWQRLMIQVILFGFFATIYFCPGKIISYYTPCL